MELLNETTLVDVTQATGRVNILKDALAVKFRKQIENKRKSLNQE